MNRTQLIRKLLLLFAIGLLFNFNLQAKGVEGKIISENDTVDVIFKIPLKLFGKQPDFEKLQNRIKYYDISGKKKILRPEQAEEIRFKYGSELFRMLSRPYKGEGSVFSVNKTLFIKLEVDGKVKMFSYYETRRFSATVHNTLGKTIPGGGVRKIRIALIQKEDGELKRPKIITFRNEMIAFFKDCPELSQKIENRDYRRADLESVIRTYNVSCGE